MQSIHYVFLSTLVRATTLYTYRNFQNCEFSHWISMLELYAIMLWLCFLDLMQSVRYNTSPLFNCRFFTACLDHGCTPVYFILRVWLLGCQSVIPLVFYPIVYFSLYVWIEASCGSNSSVSVWYSKPSVRITTFLMFHFVYFDVYWYIGRVSGWRSWIILMLVCLLSSSYVNPPCLF